MRATLTLTWEPCTGLPCFSNRLIARVKADDGSCQPGIGYLAAFEELPDSASSKQVDVPFLAATRGNNRLCAYIERVEFMTGVTIYAKVRRADRNRVWARNVQRWERGQPARSSTVGRLLAEAEAGLTLDALPGSAWSKSKPKATP